MRTGIFTTQIAFGQFKSQSEDRLLGNLERLAPVDRFFSIVRLTGSWKTDGDSFEAYVSISNDPRWQRVYGDIELNVYPRGNIRDIVDLLYANKITKERLVHDFISSFADFSDGVFKVRGIYFSLGVPSSGLRKEELVHLPISPTPPRT